MDEKNKIRMRLSVSPETEERIKLIAKKFNTRPDMAVEMAVYSLANFGKKPDELDRRLDRIENSLASIASALETEESR